jgi:hypothetical protein
MTAKIDKYYCEKCGEELLITSKVIGYNPETRKEIIQTTWCCPEWKWFLSAHTNVSGVREFREAISHRNLMAMD